MNSIKFMACVLFAAAAAFAINVGDTYDQVIAEKGLPRSQIVAGTLRILNYPRETIKIRDNVVITVTVLAGAPKQAPTPSPAPSMTPAGKVDAAKRDINDAIEKVKSIVNEPAAMAVRTPKMKVWEYEYWFEPGATKPDFETIDVRTTQKLEYDVEDFVCLKDRPNLVWAGRDLEYNPNTKYFYDDRSVPKKRLTDEDMVEINRLYRIIGRCEKDLLRVGIALPPST